MLSALYTDGHICLLKEKLNSNGTLQWSLPLKERCYCQRVVIPTFLSTQDCSTNNDNPNHLWYSLDVVPLTQKDNWTPGILDELLERSGYCGKQCDVK